MTAFLLKHMRHAKKQENTTHNKGYTQLKGIGTQVEHMLELTEDIKIIITAFHMFKKLSRHMKAIKKIQTKFL